jgi:hypothetical protein
LQEEEFMIGKRAESIEDCDVLDYGRGQSIRAIFVVRGQEPGR